jgi:hypothetical protein
MVFVYCLSLRIMLETACSSLYQMEGYRRINLPRLCGHGICKYRLLVKKNMPIVTTSAFASGLLKMGNPNVSVWLFICSTHPDVEHVREMQRAGD